MSEYGEHWERKMKTCFSRFDADGDGFLTRKDFEIIGDKIVKCGKFTGTRADEIRNNILELWTRYFDPGDGNNPTACEEFVARLKSYSKRDLELASRQQHGLWFDAVDTNKDGLIQLQEFINYFDAMGIKEKFAKEAFEGLDTNKDGVLSREEFITAGKHYSLEEESSYADVFFGSLI